MRGVFAAIMLAAAAVAIGLVPSRELVDTYTATPCGVSAGETYEVFASLVDQIPENRLLAVKIASDPNGPDTYRCCTVDRENVNQTPREDAKPAVDSGYDLTECFDCILYWES